jgi:hypothetical protein
MACQPCRHTLVAIIHEPIAKNQSGGAPRFINRKEEAKIASLAIIN